MGIYPRAPSTRITNCLTASNDAWVDGGDTSLKMAGYPIAVQIFTIHLQNPGLKLHPCRRFTQDINGHQCNAYQLSGFAQENISDNRGLKRLDRRILGHNHGVVAYPVMQGESATKSRIGAVELHAVNDKTANRPINKRIKNSDTQAGANRPIRP